MGKNIGDVVHFMDHFLESYVRISREHFVVITYSLDQRGTVWCYRLQGTDGSFGDESAASAKQRRDMTRFACQATEAAEILSPLQVGDRKGYLKEYILKLAHDDADWWERSEEGTRTDIGV